MKDNVKRLVKGIVQFRVFPLTLILSYIWPVPLPRFTAQTKCFDFEYKYDGLGSIERTPPPYHYKTCARSKNLKKSTLGQCHWLSFSWRIP
jgi:hypothetical protein